MGYDIWKDWRDEFPVTERVVYLNHAAVAPISRRCAAAMRHLADDSLDYGALHYDTWMDAWEGLRVAAARLVNADRAEIAITKNTSEGISMIALGLDWRPGDVVVTFTEEFPANLYPWLRLRQRGVDVRCLSIYDPLDKIDEACRGARLLAISFVNYLTGHRVDLDAIGEICARRGCLFFVDAIQGLGAFPLDVRRARIHALSADGHKWLLGPEGCAVLYIQRDLQDRVEPVEFGWTNTAHYADYASRDMTPRSDAGRYECGTLNTIGIFGLRAAIELILEIGVEQIAPHVQALAGRIADGVSAKGCELAAVRTPASGSGIVSFRHPTIDSRVIVRDLREKGILAAPRQGWVRTSPHFYQSFMDVDRLIDAIS